MNMVEFIFNKISSYNILNYLIPGTVLCLLLECLLEWNFLKFGNWYEAGIVFYFVGMVNSRIGSLVVEPILKKFWGSKFCGYRDYVVAEKSDSVITKLNMENNVFRSFISVSFCAACCDGMGCSYRCLSRIAIMWKGVDCCWLVDSFCLCLFKAGRVYLKKSKCRCKSC